MMMDRTGTSTLLLVHSFMGHSFIF